MKNNTLSNIQLKPASDNDIQFLYQVYRSTRINEPGLVHWPEQEREAFIMQQFELQHTHYVQNYPKAEFQIIEYNDIPVGRLYVDRRQSEIRIMDIALFPQYRKQGIGSKIMGDLITEADSKKIPLSLHVEFDNPAMKLYESLGFKKIDEYGIYHLMQRSPK